MPSPTSLYPCWEADSRSILPMLLRLTLNCIGNVLSTSESTNIVSAERSVSFRACAIRPQAAEGLLLKAGGSLRLAKVFAGMLRKQRIAGEWIER